MLDRLAPRLPRRMRAVAPWFSPACAALLVALAYATSGSPLALLALALLTALAVVSPRGTLIVLPASLSLVYQPVLVGLGTARFNPAEILLAATAAGVASRAAWSVIRSPSSWHPQLTVLRSWVGELRFAALAVGLAVAGTVSLGTVADPAHLRESVREFRWVILEPVVAYFLYCWYVREPADRWRAVSSWVIASSVVGLYSIGAGLAGAGVESEGVLRIRGLHPHPNALALYLERPLLLAATLAIAQCGRSRWLWVASAVITSAALVLTFSRGALLSILVTLGLAWMLTGHPRRTVALAVAGILAFGGLLAAAPERILSLFQGGSGSLRLHIWSAAVAMLRDYPLFGVGLDQFLYQYAPRYVAPEAWPERFTSHPHNLVLDAWLRLGLMGLALLLSGAALIVRALSHAVRTGDTLALATAVAIVGGAMHGLVDNGYFLPDLALAFWLLAAILEPEPRSLARVDEASEMG